MSPSLESPHVESHCQHDPIVLQQIAKNFSEHGKDFMRSHVAAPLDLCDCRLWRAGIGRSPKPASKDNISVYFTCMALPCRTPASAQPTDCPNSDSNGRAL